MHTYFAGFVMSRLILYSQSECCVNALLSIYGKESQFCVKKKRIISFAETSVPLLHFVVDDFDIGNRSSSSLESP